MGLNQKQVAFAEMISELVIWINSHPDGYACAYGEVERTKDQQALNVERGKSKTMNSAHLYNLAADLRIFKKDKVTGVLTYLTKSEEYKFAGDHWKSMDKDNIWGGEWQFQDGNHFQHTKV